MGIGAIYKQLTFDGEQSGDYDLYITGAGTFNAPQRDVEMITIPGRNGAFALDHGRFENIEVTYPAGVFGSDESDFADKIADIRAWLCSKKGYVRLTDEYNPNEYRLAVYKSGLEVTPALLKAGEFELVFECKPQRFLTSGETAETIAASGDTLTNPTKFNARPMLEVSGYGKIGIDGEEIEIQNGALGDVLLKTAAQQTKPGGILASVQITPDYSAVNVGDPVTVRKLTRAAAFMPGGYTGYTNFSQSSGAVFDTPSGGFADVWLQLLASGFTFSYGTAKTEWAQADFEYTKSGVQYTVTLKATISADAQGLITFSMTIVGWTLGDDQASSFEFRTGDIYGNSSQSVLGNPLYIDLDIGEAYKIENDQPVSVNNGVFLGADLPELEPGANIITYDNTVTQLKIVPRWWTV